jgi:uncharacterized protein YegL
VLKYIISMVLLWPWGSYGQGRTDCFQLRPEPPRHDFVLVIDRSGSMEGVPLERALAGAQGFVRKMKKDDRVAIVAFDSKVEVVVEMTGDRERLYQSLRSIRSGGSTVLYDALARSASLLLRQDGKGIIVFMTDGIDTGSRYSARDLESMSLSEGLFVYGIGLGRVDAEALSQLSVATGGTLELTTDPLQLGNLYERVLDTFYTTYGRRALETGAYSIRSMPAGREVRINGRSIGKTPLKLDNWDSGDHHVEVLFKRGTWQCQAPAVPGQRGFIDAREDDIGYDLWILSRPRGASVFIDDVYVGMTALYPVNTKDKQWGEKVKQDNRDLRIPLVPQGHHTVRMLAMPDFDFGLGQEITFDIDVIDRERVLSVNILQGDIQYDHGPAIRVKKDKKSEEPFDELDQLLSE